MSIGVGSQLGSDCAESPCGEPCRADNRVGRARREMTGGTVTKISLWAAVCAVAAIATACGGGGSTGPQYGTTSAAAPTTGAGATDATKAGTPTTAAQARAITIVGNDFGEPVTVQPGATVKVINNDPVEHSVTSQTGGQFNVDIEGNEEATFNAPNQAGEYAFYCTYHPMMKGTLIVQ